MNPPRIQWGIEIERLIAYFPNSLSTTDALPTPLRVDLSISALAPALPLSIADCMDYQPICQWICHQWPLTEARVNLSCQAVVSRLANQHKLAELLVFLFEYDQRIQTVDVTLTQLDPVTKNELKQSKLRVVEKRHPHRNSLTALTTSTPSKTELIAHC
jgi:hypothetical protein